MIKSQRFNLQKGAGLDRLDEFLRTQNLDKSQVILAQAVQINPGNSSILLMYQDTSPPQVSGVSPADGSGSVPTGTNISIVMSEPVTDVSGMVTITRNGVALTEGVDFTIVPTGGWPTSAFIIQNAVDTTYNATYVVTLSSTITDTAGNQMDASYVFSFTTTDQVAGLTVKAGSVTPDAADLLNGYVTVTLASNFSDANYRAVACLVGGNAQPGIGLRISNKAAGSFRIYFDGEDFSTVETGIDAADTALAAAIDLAHTTQINAQHAKADHANPDNQLTGLSTTAPGGATCADRTFQSGNTIEWIAISGAPS